MAGHVIAHVHVRRAGLRWPFPDRMAARLTGQCVLRLRRRSKYILVDLEDGETLIIHLGMSGRMLIHHRDGAAVVGALHHVLPAPEKHDHVIFDMDTGTRIAFNDARRFGAMDICATDAVDQHKLLRDLGPEPLGNSFNAAYLSEALNNRNTPIKSALLDQKLVAGLGNIYVCETLWRAHISPNRKAKDISGKEGATLVPVIRDILTEAIAAGGSSLKDFRQTDGELGYFQHAFAAYGREAEPCLTLNCKGKIARIVQSGRSTFYCPKCQR